MNRIIIIDGCAANIIFPSRPAGCPVATHTVVSGRLIPSAILLAKAGRCVSVMGEAGRDPLGDIIVSQLEAAGVATDCIDRYADGSATPCTLVFPSDNLEGELPRSIVYNLPLEERWDSKWPSPDSSDIVVFGGYFALQPRVRGNLVEFLNMARERGALIVNLPGFNPRQAPNITKVMPAILENLELADAVITASCDLRHIFGKTDARECYDEKVRFYTSLMVNIDTHSHALTLMCNGQTHTRQLPEAPSADGVLSPALQPALFADALQQLGINGNRVNTLSDAELGSIADLTSLSAPTSYIEL